MATKRAGERRIVITIFATRWCHDLIKWKGAEPLLSAAVDMVFVLVLFFSRE